MSDVHPAEKLTFSKKCRLCCKFFRGVAGLLLISFITTVTRMRHSTITLNDSPRALPAFAKQKG